MAARASLREHPDTVWAYLAGLVDGEGTITIHRRRASRIKDRREYIAVVSIAQKNRAICDWVKDVLGVGTVTLHRYADPHHYVHTWIGQSNIAYEFIKAIRPYLQIKARHADIVLAFQEARREWTDGKIGGRRRAGFKGTLPTPPELTDRYQAWLEEIQLMNRRVPENQQPLLEARIK